MAIPLPEAIQRVQSLLAAHRAGAVLRRRDLGPETGLQGYALHVVLGILEVRGRIEWRRTDGTISVIGAAEPR